MGKTTDPKLPSNGLQLPQRSIGPMYVCQSSLSRRQPSSALSSLLCRRSEYWSQNPPMLLVSLRGLKEVASSLRSSWQSMFNTEFQRRTHNASPRVRQAGHLKSHHNAKIMENESMTSSGTRRTLISRPLASSSGVKLGWWTTRHRWHPNQNRLVIHRLIHSRDRKVDLSFTDPWEQQVWFAG